MQGLRLNCTWKIERLNVWVTRMINEPRFVSIEHSIKAQREKFAPIPQLYQLLALFLLYRIIHIKQVAQPLVIIKWASHVTLLLCDNFTSILHDEGTLLNLFHSDHTPHHCLLLAYANDLQLVMLLVFLGHQVVQTLVLIAATHRVALIEPKDFINTVCSSHLWDYHAASLRTLLSLVGRIEKFAVPSVASALLRILAAICASAEGLAFYFFSIIVDILV